MLKKELSIFLVVGCLTVGIDFLTYNILIFFTGLTYEPAKALSFVSGTIFAYMANKIWTFGHTQAKGRILPFGALYACSLGVNVGVNSAVIYLFGQENIVVQAAFLIATGCSTVLNFVGMKFFVFKKAQGELSL